MSAGRVSSGDKVSRPKCTVGRCTRALRRYRVGERPNCRPIGRDGDALELDAAR
jgi:hypothetical protein